MKKFTLITALSLPLWTGCDKEKEHDVNQTNAEETVASAKVTEAEVEAKMTASATGLSVENIEKFRNNRPSPNTPFAESTAAAKAKLGDPTHTENDSQSWALVEGEKCIFFTIRDIGGASMVASGTIDQLMKTQFDECVAKTR